MQTRRRPSDPSSAPSRVATWIGERTDAEGERESVDAPLPVDTKSRDTAPESRRSITGAHEMELGRVIDDRYQIEALLGQGAVGLVYRCRHLVLDRDVAIKVLRPDFARDAELSERFVVEAKAASAIGSPHIIEVIDFGRLPDDSAFFVMEYLEGQSLAELMRDAALTSDEILHVAIQITRALDAAHACGIIHRDLKPDNVFIIDRNGDTRFVKILDFGIVKLARGESKLTRAGQIYGTPHYMSPEQASGRETDLRTDVYALGVMLFEMVTGNVPFDADEPLAVLTQHLHDDPPEIHSTDHRGFEPVVRKCLAKDPSDRYASMTELRAELERLKGGKMPHALPALRVGARDDADVPSSGGAGASRSGYSAMAQAASFFAVVGVVLSGILGYALFKQHRSEQTAAQAAAALAASQAAAVAEDEASPASSEPQGQDVMVIVIPAEAKILWGKRDLGPMPVTVNVPEGKTVHLSLLHPGYVSRRLTLDGSKARVVVGLVPVSRAGSRASHSTNAEAEADEAAARSVHDRSEGALREPEWNPLDPAVPEPPPEQRRRPNFDGLGSPQVPNGPR